MSPVLPFASPILSGETWLEVDLLDPHLSLGWTVLGEGWARTNKAIWHKVSDGDLSPTEDPKQYFRKRLIDTGRSDSDLIGFLTSASLLDYSESVSTLSDVWVRVVGTVGLGNAVHVAESSNLLEYYGTINLLIQTSVPLSLSASIEAVSVATEARTAAVLDARIPVEAGRIATGTGTDCIGIVSPDRNCAEIYVGKHTDIGRLIGKSVYEVVTVGIRKWKENVEDRKKK
ncbi:adenosylcobinamide amidohydrolase [Leptospira fletcheri]|uniref:adenosylcobinamide amidohydrolase n=1 Tax=Leptospira fletcheri TaxID=2484981 RepID=UPI001AEF969C|nr:adenosylcobinamide amidohydrolase [Leptospira fletcheri]